MEDSVETLFENVLNHPDMTDSLKENLLNLMEKTRRKILCVDERLLNLLNENNKLKKDISALDMKVKAFRDSFKAR